MFLRWRRQASRQPGAVTAENLLVHFYGSAVTAPPFGCSASYAGCHGSCSSAFLRHGSYCVLRSTSFNRSSLPLHCTTFAVLLLLQRHGPANISHWLSTGGTQAFYASLHTAHWVPFRSVHRFFISVLLSPPAAHNLRAGRPTSAAFAKVLR